MGDDDQIKWLRTTANDLNNLIQVISESSKALKPLFEKDTEALRYYSFLSSGLERAQKVTAQMAERLGGLTVQSFIEPAPPAQPPIVAESAKAPPVDASIQNPDGPGELIMVIDDEQIVLDLASAVLEGEGYRVIASTDGFKAISVYTKLKNEISLVILDYTMPVMDGSEVFDELRQIDANASIVLSSGFAEQDKVRSMLARGLRGFLPKPYTKQKLLSQVRSTLDAIERERTGVRRVL